MSGLCRGLRYGFTHVVDTSNEWAVGGAYASWAPWQLFFPELESQHAPLVVGLVHVAKVILKSDLAVLFLPYLEKPLVVLASFAMG